MKLPFRKAKLTGRLALAGAIAVLVTLAVAGSGEYAQRAAGARLAEALDTNLVAANAHDDIGESRLLLANGVREFRTQLLRGGDAEALARHGDQRRTAFALLGQRLDELQMRAAAVGLAPADIEAAAAQARAVAAAYEEAAASFDGARAADSAARIDRQVAGREGALESTLRGFAERAAAHIDAQTRLATQQSGEFLARMRLVTVAIGVAGLAATGLLMFALAGWIRRQLGGEPAEAVAAAERIASGDLSSPIAVARGDQASLMASLARMQDDLRLVLREVAAGAGDLTGASRGLSVASEQVAAATSQQSEAAASMAASVEQMTVSIDQLTQHSGEALRASQHTGELSARGNDAVQATVGEMGGIAVSAHELTGVIERLGAESAQISRIVQVIGEIASQTNLLALNAAIEAARAGEQGRGFSVVADEVRKLAERTTQSTQEIARMIEAIQGGTGEAVAYMKRWSGKVNEGAEKAKGAGEVMARVTADAARSAQAVTGIAGALSEQSSASSQIAQNVERIARMSEENSAAVGAMAESARRLDGLAAQLMNLVGRFHLAEAPGLAAAGAEGRP